MHQRESGRQRDDQHEPQAPPDIAAASADDDVRRKLGLHAELISITTFMLQCMRSRRACSPPFAGRYAIRNEAYDPIALGRLAAAGLLIATVCAARRAQVPARRPDRRAADDREPVYFWRPRLSTRCDRGRGRSLRRALGVRGPPLGGSSLRWRQASWWRSSWFTPPPPPPPPPPPRLRGSSAAPRSGPRPGMRSVTHPLEGLGHGRLRGPRTCPRTTPTTSCWRSPVRSSA